MSCETTFNLNDANGVTWAVGILDNGALTTTALAAHVDAEARIVADSSSGTSYWQLGVDTLGRLTATKVLTPTGRQFISLRSANSTLFYLMVLNTLGNLATFNTNSMITDPVVGQLFNSDLVAFLNAAKQPNGVGTPVTDPTQAFGERIGKWFPGCGHSFNNWDIASCAVGCTTAALIRCPMCGYVQRILVPYSLIHADANYIIFA